MKKLHWMLFTNGFDRDGMGIDWTDRLAHAATDTMISIDFRNRQAIRTFHHKYGSNRTGFGAKIA